MNSLVHIAELSLASTSSEPLTQERIQAIAEIRNPIKRLVATAINGQVLRNPAATQAFINQHIRDTGFRLIGFGYEALAYKHDDKVRKVLHRTIPMPPEQQKTELGKLVREFPHLRAFLGDTALRQDMFIAPHPLLANVTAVQVSQDYCDFDPSLHLFERDSSEVDVATIDMALHTYPGLEDALTDFTAGARQMVATTGYLPDTNSAENLVIGQIGNHAPELYLLDGRPLGPEYSQAQQTIMRQLDSLDDTLRLLAA